jgi:toxin HigB-1
MIVSSGDAATEDLYHGRRTSRTRRFSSDLRRAVLRKLDMLNAAAQLADLRVPPANRLEALQGDLRGRYSIRVNDQWRIVFRWLAGGAHEVTLPDYDS